MVYQYTLAASFSLALAWPHSCLTLLVVHQALANGGGGGSNINVIVRRAALHSLASVVRGATADRPLRPETQFEAAKVGRCRLTL
jgi:hypothetical protein